MLHRSRCIVALAALLVGCGADVADVPDAQSDVSAPEDVHVTPDAATDAPVDADAGPSIPSPIRYVLVLLKENHTFDNYFTGFPGATSSLTAKEGTTTVTRPVAPNGPLAGDICHTNACGVTAYDKGAMNGFATAGLVRYTESQIPNYWQYARNFVLADHYFATTLAPSSPGHIVLWNAQSPIIDNPVCPKGGDCNGFGCVGWKDATVTQFDPVACTTKTVAPCFDIPTVVDHLPDGFTWANYGQSYSLLTKSVAALPNFSTHMHAENALLPDLENGKLANLTIAHLGQGDTSEHPPYAPCAGENSSVDIINAAMKLPEWNEMAIIVTWDDWGGFYDSVAPTIHKCANGNIFNTGFRLPAIIISPYAKKGFVLHTPTEQASVPRLVEELWGMEFMTKRDPHARDATAGSLMGAFDFTQAPRAPLELTTRTCP